MKQQEQIMVDWTELEKSWAVIDASIKQKEAGEIDAEIHRANITGHVSKLTLAFPAILSERREMLAKLEAAQRLRDAADEARSWMTKPRAQDGMRSTVENVGLNQRRIISVLQDALAAFDKETE